MSFFSAASMSMVATYMPTVIAALKVAVRRTQAAVTEDGDEPITYCGRSLTMVVLAGVCTMLPTNLLGATAK